MESGWSDWTFAVVPTRPLRAASDPLRCLPSGTGSRHTTADERLGWPGHARMVDDDMKNVLGRRINLDPNGSLVPQVHDQRFDYPHFR